MISNNDSKPKFSENEVKQHLNEFYNLQGNLSYLPSYLDQNFQLISNNQQFVCKISNLEELSEHLIFQNQMMQHLHDKNNVSFPQLMLPF